MASGTLILPLVLAVVLVSFVIAALLAYRSVRQRRDRLAKQRELEQYENALQMDRAQRALQRAREVLAERTGNAGWNPQLEQRVRSMQLETKTAPSLGDDSTGGLVSPSGDPVKVSERAMQLVIEYGAQGAMMQVMHAAKKQLDKEMRELEASERFPGSELEEDSEDPVWRTRVKDQMQLKELEKQLAAVDEETQDMLSEEERRRQHQLEELDQEGLVSIETFPGTGHNIVVRKQPRPPPRPVAWAKMSASLHRPAASEELVQRSVLEGRSVQSYSSALRAMAAEVERSDDPSWREPLQPAANAPSVPELYTGAVGLPPPFEIVSGKRHLTEDGVIVASTQADHEPGSVSGRLP